jgi:hypothetical protein
MTISFSSIPSNHTPSPTGAVRYGTTPRRLHHVVQEEDPPRWYNSSHPKHGMYYSPYQHHVVIRNLRPNTRYYFQVAILPHEDDTNDYNNNNNNQNNKSQEDDEQESGGRRFLTPPLTDRSTRPCPLPHKIRSFQTAPRPGQSKPMSFAFMGDLGQFAHSQETLEHLIQYRDTLNAVFLAGDIAYTDYDQRRWDTFFDFLDDYPLVDEIPLQVCAGNHDIEKLAESRDMFQAYQSRFRMPEVNPAQLGLFDGPPGLLNMDQPYYPLPYEWGNAYYAFTYGTVRQIVMNAYSSMEPGSTQYEWLVQELLSLNRTVTPWVILMIHCPMYNTFVRHKGDPQILAEKQHIEPLLVKHKVNFIFTGHIHAYLRTSHVALGQVDPHGPVHITVGAGGRDCDAPFQSHTPEEWVEFRDEALYGYGILHIYNHSHAQWHWIHSGKSGML